MEPGSAPASIAGASIAAPERGALLAALGLMVASGCAALGYEIVWTQQSALWLGHEAAAVLAVVAAFFGGIAAGALVLGARIDRSSHPARWYAACEAAIGLWSLVLAFAMAPVSGWLLDLIGPEPSPIWQWAVAFCGTFALLLPATAAMGATLPAMERLLARMQRQGTRIAAIYAANTFGAVAGVLAAAFWWVPEFGLLRTAAVCSALNLLSAVAALRLSAEFAPAPAARSNSSRALLLLLAATGLLGIGYEVLVVRMLSQVAESTVYTFAILLAVYLVGTALGAAAYQRRPPDDAVHARDRLLRALAATCLLGTAGLWNADKLKAVALQLLGPSLPAALGAEAVLALAVFLPPTFVMGMLFSHLATAARAAGIGFGRALGVNTLGASIAPVLFGVQLLPALGAKPALLLVAAGYLLLSSRRAWSAPGHWATAAAALALIWAPALTFVDVPDGGRVVSYREGATAAVSVVEDANGVARLRIDNHAQEGSNATLVADARQALLPLLLHPSPRRALFLGLGTGVTASSAAEEAQLRVDAVELLPEVIDASRYFRRAFDGGQPDPRLHIVAADARRFVRASRQSYDLIVSDNFHPARSGSGALYTVEHFEAVRERLAAGGVFCQWLPLHQLDLETLRSIVRSFITVYPSGAALLATHSLDTPVLGLVARRDAGRFDIAQIRERMAGISMPRSPAEFGLADDLALLGSFVAGPRALARFASDAPLNTDDHPVVAYRAPRITYVPESRPRDRLIDLLSLLGAHPQELVAGSTPAWDARLAAYWSARNRFIEIGRDVEATRDVRRMLEQVREPLLSIVRTSPDFRPAYDPLLRMAAALGRTDPAAARALLVELERAQPARAEAAQALRDLSTN